MLSIILLIILLLAVACASLRHMHGFQLNSYKFAEHKSYLVRNVGPLCLLLILAALCGISSLFSEAVGMIVSSVICLLYAAAAKPIPKKRAKKPLVFTARVKRMLFTESLIVAAFIIIWAIFIPARLYPAGAAVLLIIAPYLNLAANALNAPVEGAIRKYYLNDAKRLLSSHPSLKVVGITGSYGKTGTKYALSTLLSHKYDVLMTPASYNTPMGVTMTVRASLKATTEIFVCEMGAKYVGDIDELCRLVDPDIGIITSVGAQHLETFGTLDRIKKTKFELFDYLSDKGGQVAVGFDNENIADELQTRGGDTAIKCGLSDGSDYLVSNVRADEEGTSFTLTLKQGESVDLTVALLGAHNVSNVACAAAVAHRLGMTLEEIKAAARRIESAPHRLQIRKRGRDILIDDAYNANPAGTRAALDALSLFDAERIIVTPGMIELGAESDKFNRELGKNAAAVCSYIVLVGERQTRPILEGALEAGFDKGRIRIFERVGDAIDFAFSVSSQKRRAVLIENDLPDNY